MWFAQLAGMGAITGVMAFLPLYIGELGISSLEETELWSGILLGIASLTAALSGPHWGVMADRHGRKLMVERVMLAFFIVMVGMGFVANVYQLFVLRVIQGIAGGFSAAALALVTSITPQEHITSTLGIFQTAMIAGSAFGPLFGGLVSDHFGYRWAFIAFGILCLLSLLIVHFAVTEHFVPAPKAARQPVWQEVKQIVAIPGLGLMLSVQFFIQFSVMVIAPLLPIYVQQLAPDLVYIASTCGAIIAVAGLTSAVASVGTGKVANRLNHHTSIWVAAILAALCFAAQALAGSVLVLGIMRGLSGIFLGAMLPTINAVIFFLIPPAKRGVAFGITNGAMQMGNVFGPLTGGVLALSFSIPTVFWLSSLLFVVVAAIAGLSGLAAKTATARNNS
jgi:DHA1 family multidrug resistance protein-like MFS transporter